MGDAVVGAPVLTSLLALTNRTERLLIWLIVLMAMVIVLGFAVWYTRRWMFVRSESREEAWTLEDLRRMRDEGSLSAEEYERLRETMIGQLRPRAADEGATDRSAGPPQPPHNP